MDGHGRNNNRWSNARIPPPSVIISSRKAQCRNDDLNLRFKQTAQSNTTSFSTNSALGFHPKAVVKKIYIEIHPLSNSDVLTQQTTSRKTYKTIPPTQSQPKQIPVVLSTNPIEQTNSQVFSGQYHYAPEAEETEINENDSENIDVKLVASDLPKLSPSKLLSLEKFRHEQSLLPYNGALIFVPEYVDDMKTELTVDFLQSNPVDAGMVQLSLVPPLTTLKILNKQNINDVRSLIRITRKIKPLPVPKSEVASKSVNVSNKVKANLTETIFNKPVKDIRVSTKTIKKPSVLKEAIIKKEDLRSVESAPLVLPIQSKLTTDDNTSRVVVRRSQSSSLNTHSSKKQQPSPLAIQNNKEATKKQIQRIAATKKHVITSAPKLPVKKSVPTVTHKKMETEFPWDNFDNNENGADTCKFGFNIFLL